MVLFSEKSLRLMPSNTLVATSNSLQLERQAKQAKLSTTNRKLEKAQGIATMRTPMSGRVTVVNDSQTATSNQRQNLDGPSNALSNAAGLFTSEGTNPGGAAAFVPGTVDFDYSQDDIETMRSQINSQSTKSQTVRSSAKTTEIASLTMTRDRLSNEIGEIDDVLEKIEEIMRLRSEGLAPEPMLNISALDLNALPGAVKSRVQSVIDQTNQFITGKIVAPFTENQKLLRYLNASLSGTKIPSPVFDLEYGPPISSKGKFVLSNDGLYYDSRTQPVPDILPFATSSQMWTLQFDSNRGGRGLSFTEDDAVDGVGTIFDLNLDLGQNTNERVQDFYNYDDVLQQFNDDKVSHTTEASGYVAEILSNGYDASDAVVRSYTAQMNAAISVYDKKIKKRKRQLEIAAIYGRDKFFVTDRDHPVGEGVFFEYRPPVGKAAEYKLQYDDLPDAVKSRTFLSLSGGDKVAWDKSTGTIVTVRKEDNVIGIVGQWVEIPRIPVNDFSYLKESDIAFDVQRKLTLFSEDLDTIIAPHQARYVVAPNKPTSLERLSVEPIGFGDWVHRETSGSLSATTPLTKSLTSDIVKDGLLACYNFLDPEAVTEPSGTLYALNNAAEGSTRLDAKLVGYDKSYIFPSGVGIAYMGGTVFDQRQKLGPSWADIKGSYVRLPNNTKEFETFNTSYKGTRGLENLFYQPKGASIDFWAYVPNIHSDMTDNHRYRLVFANENSGPVNSNYVNTNIIKNGTTNLDRTLGMIIGWRDAGSPDNATGYDPSGLEFIIAPTTGQNQTDFNSAANNWGHSICIAERWDGQNDSSNRTPTPDQVTQMGMYIPSGFQTAAGSGIADASGSFIHFNLSFDAPQKEVRVCLNGALLATSSYTDVFGDIPSDVATPTASIMDPAQRNTIPDFCDPSKESFLGVSLYDERVSPQRVGFPVFTPWIIGGGYSDNIPKISGSTYRPQGFLGSNTNHTHQETLPGASLATVTVGDEVYIKGQHEPPLSGSRGGTGNDRNRVPRSGLDGFVGSFKIYENPLTIKEAKFNYDSQKGFFENILL
jgi:hypothetical protein